MGIEIERKFLVNEQLLPKLQNGIKIEQGYISSNENGVVRVRIKDNQGYLTIKSLTKSITRSEYEYEIPLEDAKEILENICIESRISKTRYIIPHSSLIWELDIFHGQNSGLIIAEVELKEENQIIDLPNWVEKEVSYEEKYFNSNLINMPFCKWKDK